MVNINKKRCYFFRAWKELAVLAFVFFADILSKLLISTNMVEYQTKTLIPKFLHFYYEKNYNAAFSFNFFNFFGQGDKMGEDGKRWFFIIFVSIATLLFFVFLLTGNKNCFLYRLSLAMIVGGALGNLYDRIAHGGVRDFIQVEFFGKQLFGNRFFATFNLADSSLVMGVMLFIVYFLFFFIKDEKRKLLEAESAKAAKQAQKDAENAQKAE